MLTPQFLLPIHRELVIDLFAGGGGASTGIEQAIGRPVDIAINHDPEAVALHQSNHPQTLHYVSDVFAAAPRVVTDGRPVGLLWASPDCTFHSKARGGKPHRDRNQARRRRGLAGVVVKWAAAVRPRVIAMENVEEFQHWGPLNEHGLPCAARRGKSFARWVAQLRNLGYQVEWRELRGCDYGAPTIRKRLFIIARCDGAPITWPEPSHGAPGSLPVKAKKVKPWPVAADCIDWTLPCPSIFERAKPLADATCRRVAKGIMRYVVNAAEPFIVPVDIAPTLVGIDNQSSASGSWSATEPLRTTTTENRHALVAAFLAKHYTGVVGSDLHDPLATVTSQDHHSLVTSNLVKMRGTCRDGQPVTEPLHTISAGGTHHAEVRAFLTAYYATEQDTPLDDPMHTVPTRDRFGLVTVHGQPYEIIDIGLRMLAPRELYRAQGFPDHFIIDRGADGRELTKTTQVRLCGNSVCPPLARAIVTANYSEHAVLREVA